MSQYLIEMEDKFSFSVTYHGLYNIGWERLIEPGRQKYTLMQIN